MRRWLDANAVPLLVLSCLLGVLAIAVGCRTFPFDREPWPVRSDGSPLPKECVVEGPIRVGDDGIPRRTWAVIEGCDVEPSPEPDPTPTPTPGPPDPTPSPPPPEPAPEPTPEPAPEPVACEPVEWTGYCGEHRDAEIVDGVVVRPADPILHEDAVREAIRSVLLRDPRFREGQSLPEHLWVAYAEAVTEELNAVGLCASKTSPPGPSKEEIAVWTGPEQREHWDIVVGDGDRIGVQQLFLAWLCTDGDAEPGPTPEPVERGQTCTADGIVDPATRELQLFASSQAACDARLAATDRSGQSGGHGTRRHVIAGERWHEDLGSGGGWYDSQCNRWSAPEPRGGRRLAGPEWFGVECSP